jgi:hypothetical protein
MWLRNHIFNSGTTSFGITCDSSPPPKAHPVQFGRRREQYKKCSSHCREAISTSINDIIINGWLRVYHPHLSNLKDMRALFIWLFISPERIAVPKRLSFPHGVIHAWVGQKIMPINLIVRQCAYLKVMFWYFFTYNE